MEKLTTKEQHEATVRNPHLRGKKWTNYPIITGWLIIAEEDLHPIDFIVEEDGPDEAPYSNDTGIFQFHLQIDFTPLADDKAPIPSIIE